MSLPLEPTSTLDRIRRNLVGLKMARALEVLDQTVGRIERGEITVLDAIDPCSPRNSRCARTGGSRWP